MAHGLAIIVQCFVFVCNLIFVVCGIVLIAIGSLVEIKARNYLNLLGDSYMSTATVFIILGVIVFFTAFLGCWGACTQNVCMLIMFSVILFFLFVGGLATGIVAFVHKNDLQGIVYKGLRNNFNDALNNKPGATQGWEHIQHDFKCCGFEGPSDFNVTQPIPFLSCCKNLDTEVNCTIEYAQPKGCKYAVVEFFGRNIGLIGALGVGISCAEVFFIMLVCCLTRSLK